MKKKKSKIEWRQIDTCIFKRIVHLFLERETFKVTTLELVMRCCFLINVTKACFLMCESDIDMLTNIIFYKNGKI